jgi:hypothetical protein
MTLQGLPDLDSIPGSSVEFKQFVATVRLYIRDFPELNRLVSGEESSSRMVAWAVIDAIEEFNGRTPIIGTFTFTDLLTRGQGSLLRRGTVINLLTSVGILQTRNHLPFSDGGLNVAISDKTPLLQSWIQLFGRQWEMGMDRVKKQWNVEQLLGGPSGAHTEYFALSGYYHIDLTR